MNDNARFYGLLRQNKVFLPDCFLSKIYIQKALTKRYYHKMEKDTKVLEKVIHHPHEHTEHEHHTHSPESLIAHGHKPYCITTLGC